MQLAANPLMRTDIFKFGLNMIIAGIVLVTLATFFHAFIADLLGLSLAGEMRFVFHGLFWGGLTACAGIVVSLSALVRGGGRPTKTLLPVCLALAAAIIIFLILLFISFHREEEPRLRPGETITI